MKTILTKAQLVERIAHLEQVIDKLLAEIDELKQPRADRQCEIEILSDDMQSAIARSVNEFVSKMKAK